MQNQIVFFRGDGVNNPTRTWQTALNTTVIGSGQPAVITLAMALPTQYVEAAPDASPIIGTHIFAGFSNGFSNQTTSADGTAVLYVPDQYAVCLLPAKVAANIATQSQYNALVNSYVLFDLTASVYTVDESTVSAAVNGLMIVDLDVNAFPGMVAFIIRQTATWLS